jgi:hypothetical protein
VRERAVLGCGATGSTPTLLFGALLIISSLLLAQYPRLGMRVG